MPLSRPVCVLLGADSEDRFSRDEVHIIVIVILLFSIYIYLQLHLR